MAPNEATRAAGHAWYTCRLSVSSTAGKALRAEKAARQRHGAGRKWAKKVVRDCDRLVVEDKTSAHVMLGRAGFIPAGVDCGRP